jgi:hypothetical protein
MDVGYWRWGDFAGAERASQLEVELRAGVQGWNIGMIREVRSLEQY